MKRIACLAALLLSLPAAAQDKKTCSQGMEMVEAALDSFELDEGERYKAEMLLRNAIIAQEMGQERKCKVILGDIIHYYFLKERSPAPN
jgi:hypothetical protein